MNERLLQYIWQFRYFNTRQLFTVQGEPVMVIQPGSWNVDQGPDFSNARLRIGATLWAGNVEIHLNTSDWKKHGHSGDERYEKIIAHVVWNHDDADWPENIPLIELKSRVSQLMLDTYSQWLHSGDPLPCSGSINAVPPLVWTAWKDRLIAERWEMRIIALEKDLEKTQGHWEEIGWRLFCRYMGSKVNTESFEQIARHIPLNIIARHQNQIHQLEALLLGVAGLLQGRAADKYHELLQKEYLHLRNKYKLQVINKPPVFLRLRPANFPTIRLVQLAMLLHRQPRLFARLLQPQSLASVREMLQAEPNHYWLTHYRPGEESAAHAKPLGAQTIDVLIANAVLPAWYAYERRQLGRTGAQALEWLQHLPKEVNKITRLFEGFGIRHEQALDSQAFLQLKKEYCDPRRCLSCAVAASLFRRQPV